MFQVTVFQRQKLNQRSYLTKQLLKLQLWEQPTPLTGQGIVAFVILRGGIEHANGDELVKELRNHVAKEIGAIAKASSDYGRQ
jgi:hypothetical protein